VTKEKSFLHLNENNIPLLTSHSSKTKALWSIGGGKEGTGKSLVSSCLGIELANLNHEVFLINTDETEPNLLTFLGLKESKLHLDDLISRKNKKTEELTPSGPLSHLTLIQGKGSLLFQPDLNYYKKLTLLRHLKEFENKVIIFDLGSGTINNEIDFFIIANPGILVINPDPVSIESAYYFLKSCIIRIFKLYIDYYQIHSFIKSITTQIYDSSKSVYSFLNEIISRDRTYAQIFFTALKQFRPGLIVNKIRDEKDALLGESIVNMVQKYLVTDLHFLGTIPYDEKMFSLPHQQESLLDRYHQSPLAPSVKNIAKKLIQLASESPP